MLNKSCDPGRDFCEVGYTLSGTTLFTMYPRRKYVYHVSIFLGNLRFLSASLCFKPPSDTELIVGWTFQYFISMNNRSSRNGVANASVMTQ